MNVEPRLAAGALVAHAVMLTVSGVGFGGLGLVVTVIAAGADGQERVVLLAFTAVVAVVSIATVLAAAFEAVAARRALRGDGRSLVAASVVAVSGALAAATLGSVGFGGLGCLLGVPQLGLGLLAGGLAFAAHVAPSERDRR